MAATNDLHRANARRASNLSNQTSRNHALKESHQDLYIQLQTVKAEFCDALRELRRLQKREGKLNATEEQLKEAENDVKGYRRRIEELKRELEEARGKQWSDEEIRKGMEEIEVGKRGWSGKYLDSHSNFAFTNLTPITQSWPSPSFVSADLFSAGVKLSKSQQLAIIQLIASKALIQAYHHPEFSFGKPDNAKLIYRAASLATAFEPLDGSRTWLHTTRKMFEKLDAPALNAAERDLARDMVLGTMSCLGTEWPSEESMLSLFHLFAKALKFFRVLQTQEAKFVLVLQEVEVYGSPTPWNGSSMRAIGQEERKEEELVGRGVEVGFGVGVWRVTGNFNANEPPEIQIVSKAGVLLQGADPQAEVSIPPQESLEERLKRLQGDGAAPRPKPLSPDRRALLQSINHLVDEQSHDWTRLGKVFTLTQHLIRNVANMQKEDTELEKCLEAAQLSSDESKLITGQALEAFAGETENALQKLPDDQRAKLISVGLVEGGTKERIESLVAMFKEMGWPVDVILDDGAPDDGTKRKIREMGEELKKLLAELDKLLAENKRLRDGKTPDDETARKIAKLEDEIRQYEEELKKLLGEISRLKVDAANARAAKCPRCDGKGPPPRPTVEDPPSDGEL